MSSTACKAGALPAELHPRRGGRCAGGSGGAASVQDSGSGAGGFVPDALLDFGVGLAAAEQVEGSAGDSEEEGELADPSWLVLVLESVGVAGHQVSVDAAVVGPRACHLVLRRRSSPQARADLSRPSVIARCRTHRIGLAALETSVITA